MNTSIPVSVLGLAASLLITGCAIGNKHQYAEAAPTIQSQAGKRVAIGVLDKRPAILNKTKTENFVGLQRGGFGNPFDVTTASGRPLAQDMTSALATALRQGGSAEVREVALSPVLSEAEAVRLTTAGGFDRSVLLMLNEWKADTMTNTALLYDVRLSVLDSSGKLLASRDLLGRDNLGGSFMNPPEHARTAVPAAFKAKMGELFASPDIASALR